MEVGEVEQVVFQVERRTAAGWAPESGGRFVVGENGLSHEAQAKFEAIQYANTVTETMKQEVRVIRIAERQVWPV
jgi:hypothetical protein